MAKNKHEQPIRFPVGTVVRVRPGTADPDFPEFPLGGWVGKVADINQKESPPLYLIEWSRHTLDQIHPIYSKRSERDGLEIEKAWLNETELEPDDPNHQLISDYKYWFWNNR